MAADARAHLDVTAACAELFDVGRPSRADWHPLHASLDAEWMRARIAQIASGDGHGRRPRAVAGAYFGGDLAWAVALPVAAALAVDRRVLDIAIDNVHVHIDSRGWPTRIALEAARFTCLPSDPAAASAGVTVAPDEHALIEAAAAQILQTFGEVFASVRRESPYGLSGLWGGLADHLSSVAWLLHGRGCTPEDVDRTWSTTEALVDAVQRGQPRLRARPRRFRFDGAEPPVELPMRATCCLAYTTPEALASGGDGLCTTCPRRHDDERVQLVNARFRAEAGAT